MSEKKPRYKLHPDYERIRGLSSIFLDGETLMKQGEVEHRLNALHEENERLRGCGVHEDQLTEAQMQNAALTARVEELEDLIDKVLQTENIDAAHVLIQDALSPAFESFVGSIAEKHEARVADLSIAKVERLRARIEELEAELRIDPMSRLANAIRLCDRCGKEVAQFCDGCLRAQRDEPAPVNERLAENAWCDDEPAPEKGGE
jgi:hypothetical protein